MRVYVEKSRSTVGWKGLAHDPDLDGSARLKEDLLQSRQLYADMTEQGLPTASELLDMVTPASLVDFISVGVIGARTTESQPHRELASIIPFPIGFKDSTDGSVAALRRGVSITDGCLGWADTVACLESLADTVLFRRKLKICC
ncbi:3-deoxy-7-phosphoheptulonate synthase [Penicillium odoratum]|uniref:3-deoxy-7-phosphoheptulonate synthase n=1 Tax=Penicillium odoratum TaxID=1167516 RepID=UPI0025489F40|nr:3-deoxy-7-phosphoheptulonate synthase [Penicillium odoratum]KAJ5777517.1 3-deoxy-7-phosphoheptulonate synthase [Penicillium odoratum]